MSGWGDAADLPISTPSTVVKPSPLLLYGAVGVGLLSVLLALVAGRNSGPVALVGWLLAGVVAIVLVALQQERDLKAALSVWYVPDGSIQVVRWVALAVIVVGVVLNSIFFAQWVATR